MQSGTFSFHTMRVRVSNVIPDLSNGDSEKSQEFLVNHQLIYIVHNCLGMIKIAICLIWPQQSCCLLLLLLCGASWYSRIIGSQSQDILTYLPALVAAPHPQYTVYYLPYQRLLLCKLINAIYLWGIINVPFFRLVFVGGTQSHLGFISPQPNQRG